MTTVQQPIVYTTEQCPACERTKQILSQQGVQYDVITASAETILELKARGHRAFPVVAYDGEEHAGFQMPKLREIARRYFASRQTPAMA